MALQRRAKAPAPPRPPEIPNGGGKKFLRMIEPVRLVELDAGVYDYLWRIIEQRLEIANGKGETYADQADMLQRAADEFRRVHGHEQPLKPVRRIARSKK